MLYVTGMSQNGTTYSSFPQMVLLFVLPIIAVTYFLAIFWSAAFEFGFGKVEDALIGALIGRSVRSSAVNEEAKEQTAVKKDNDNWDAESPVNGQARPAYANDIVNNNKDD
uniref:Uncharacterized protein n=1 Tax=Acrobeloides nanus TaxID=290746 RepID=A0A914EKU6_9BILA